MKKTNIPLGSINRNANEGSAHLLNLRLKDGAFRPVSVPDEVKTAGRVEYIHSSSDYKNLIGYFSNDGITSVLSLGEMGNEDPSKVEVIGSFDGEVNEIQHVGNTLVFLTTTGIYYFLYKEGRYKSLGNQIPTPKIKFKATDYAGDKASNTVETDERIFHSIYFAKSTDSEVVGIDFRRALVERDDHLEKMKEGITDDFTALYNKSIDQIADLGCVPEFPLQMCYAVKLFDGTYVKQSCPVLVTQGNGLEKMIYTLMNFNEGIGNFFVPTRDGFENFSDPTGEYKRPPLPVTLLGVGEGNMKFSYIVYPTVTPEAYNWGGYTLKKEKLNSLTTHLSPDEFASRYTPIFAPLITSFMELSGNSINRKSISWNKEQLFKSSRLALKVRSLYFSIELPDAKLLADWEDVISSIDIFVSKQVTPFKIGEQLGFPVDDNTQTMPGYGIDGEKVEMAKIYNTSIPHKKIPSYSTQEIFDQVKNNGNFYKIKSIGIYDKEYTKEQYQSSDWISLATEVHDKFRQIEQEELLTNNSYAHSVTARASYVYNQSLHLADITTSLFKGFSPVDYTVVDSTGNKTDAGFAITRFNDTERNVCVSVNDTPAHEGVFISPMIFYPDINASSIDIGILHSDGVCRKVTLQLSPHPALNGAYYLDPELKAIETPIEAEMLTSASEHSGVREEHNKLLVTSVSNPFTFSVERTNYVGSGTIIAVRAATTELSQGQFGQFPLYVFCSDGVYTLSTNSEGKYTTAHSVSFDVLLSKKLITSIDNAVIFGTAQGVKILSGSNTAVLSDVLNGAPHQYDNDGDYKNPYLDAIANHLKFPAFDDVLRNVDAVMSFDYPHNEFWLATPGEPIAYIYNLSSKTWTYRSLNAEKLISAYPSLYMRKGTSLFDVTTDNDNKLDFFVITNPIGGQEFIKYHDITLDGMVKTNNLNVAVLAGNNPFRTTPIKSISFHGDMPRCMSGIHLTRIPASVRYVQLAVKGNATDAALLGFYANIDSNKYNSTR